MEKKGRRYIMELRDGSDGNATPFYEELCLDLHVTKLSG